MIQKKEKLIPAFLKMGKRVDPVVKKILKKNSDPKFKDLIDYQIDVGGKRLRPSLLLTSCLLLGGKTKDALHPAAGIEILHNYSLIIDDIIDRSSIRRGKQTLWKKHGQDIAQCIGISYSASIFQAASLSKKNTLISEIFAKTIKEIVEGEILDILYERSGREEEPYVLKNRYKKISEKDYFEMIEKKTARLCQVSCIVGGMCANGTKKQIDSLGNYGLNIGIAFQIQDDILDIFGNEKDFGKEIGKDLKERKGGNILVLLALKDLKKPEQRELSLILEKENILEKDLKRAIDLIKKTKAKEKSEKMSQYYVEKGKESLKSLPKNRWNETLTLFADFLSLRKK